VTRFSLVVCLAAGVVCLASGCGTSRQQVLQADESAVKLRSMQTRVFDTTDRVKMLRTIMATLQDLSFVIDTADETIGSVTATKLNYYALKMTVTVRPRNDRQLLVRANAQYNLKAVESPEPYQDFFASLEKAIFLTAHLEEEPGAAPSAAYPAPSSSTAARTTIVPPTSTAPSPAPPHPPSATAPTPAKPLKPIRP
jgi:hypothetical protein